MLEHSIYELDDEQLKEVHDFWKKNINPYDLEQIRFWALDSLPLFPELALVTERGQLFKNARHHLEWYGILSNKLIQTEHETATPKSLVKNTIGKINKRVALEAPREHSKTTCFSVNYPLWRIAKNPNIRIILVSNTATQAESYLREVKGHIERDPVYSELFPDLIPKYPEKWTDSEIIVQRSALNLKDPTVSATGMGGTILSRRAELIIVDDILNQSNTGTQERRQKVKEWLWNVLLPVLTPDGEIVVVGTAWDADDILEDLIEKSTFDIRVRYKAIPDDTDIDPKTGKPKLLWNNLFSYEQLMQKKADDPISFYRQYQNEVHQISEAPIKQEWIHYISDPNTLPKIERIIIGVDPAVSERDMTSNAQSAIVAVGRGADGKFYVLKTSCGFWGFEKLLDETAILYWEMDMKYGIRPESVVVEDVQAQKWAIDQMRKRKNLPAIGVKPTSDKTARLRTLSPFFANDEVRLLVECKPLAIQLIGWGRERLKDLVDAFVYAMWELTAKPMARGGFGRPDMI